MIALVSSAGSWFKNIEWKKYGDYSHYLTLPGKGLPLYFNGTTATLHAVLGNIAAVGISKFLLSGYKPRVSTLKARPVGEIISLGKDIGPCWVQSRMWILDGSWLEMYKQQFTHLLSVLEAHGKILILVVL